MSDMVKKMHLPVTVEVSQNGNSMHGTQNGGSNTQAMAVIPLATAGAPGVVPGPTTNLNIGMDYWGASSTIPAMRGKVQSTPVAGGLVTTGSRDSIQSQLWLQVSSNIIQNLGLRS